MTPVPSLSVIIPAHNEEREIRATLSALLADARPGEFDVIVVPNACSDHTAEVAGGFPGVRVLVTPHAGKAGALRIGHEQGRAYPRLFLDADVRLSTASARSMLERIGHGDGVLACSPRVQWDLTGCGPVARRAHLAHDALMTPRRGLSGVGAYLLSERACDRVFPFPDVIADDEYVHRSFAPGERCTDPFAVSVTRPAESFGELVRRRARVRLGNRQLGGVPASRTVTGPTRLGPGDLVRALSDGRTRPLDALCLLVVTVAERVLAATWRVRRPGRPERRKNQ